jgi:prepilin-type processing-associated H-X9-DG protein
MTKRKPRRSARPIAAASETGAPSASVSRTIPFWGQLSDPVLSAGSYHQGGAHILMGDGAVIFMTDSVEAGDGHACAPGRDHMNDPNVRSGMESPFGLWGALGSRAAGEKIEEQLNQ